MTEAKIVDQEFQVEFTPLGESKAIVLTPSIVKEFLMVKTSRGIEATKADVRKFLELCAAQGLNPWLSDAFLIGYDTYDKAGNHTGGTFSLVTSHQAILKRAEANVQYDGMASGVITLPKLVAKQIGETGNPPEDVERLIKRREGDLLYPWETVIGGWAEVKRKDHSLLSSDALEFEVYTTGKSRWAKDPAGMIVKCAEASAQRKAFPSTLGSLYIQEEMESVREGRRELALPDGRAEQDANRIVMPDNMIDDATRRVPASRQREEPPKTVEPIKEQDRRTGVHAPGSFAKQDEPTTEREPERDEPRTEKPVRTEPEFTHPVAVQNLLGAISRANSEMSLLSIKQTWVSVKAQYPESVDAVEGALARRFESVPKIGEKK